MSFFCTCRTFNSLSGNNFCEIHQKHRNYIKTNSLNIQKNKSRETNDQMHQHYSLTAYEKYLNEKLQIMEIKITDYEFEKKEWREIIEFVTIERNLSELALREAEDSLIQKCLEWNKQINDYQQTLDILDSKFQRNHKIWLENDYKATEEIKVLDDIVDKVIFTVNSLPSNIRYNPSVQKILALLSGHTNLKFLKAKNN